MTAYIRDGKEISYKWLNKQELHIMSLANYRSRLINPMIHTLINIWT
jgi:hypothetical protein